MTAGLTTHDDIVEVEDGEDGSSHSRTASALGRQQRLRGTACLTRHLSAAAASSATDSDPATVRFSVNALPNIEKKLYNSCNLQCNGRVPVPMLCRQMKEFAGVPKSSLRQLYHSCVETCMFRLFQPVYDVKYFCATLIDFLCLCLST